MIDRFDNIVRQRLESHETPVPSDMFERVQQRRKKRKIGAFFYFKSCLSTIVGFGILLFVAYTDSDRKIVNDSPQTAINTVTREVLKPTKNTGNNIIFEKNKKLFSGKILKNENINIYKSDTYEVINNKILDTQHYLNVPNTVMALAEDFTLILPEIKDSLNPISPDFNIKNAPILFPKSVFLNKKLIFGKRKKVKEQLRSYYYYESYGSPDIALHTLDIKELRSNKQAVNYLELRKESEKGFWAFDTGIRIGIQYRSGFSIGTGLKYQQINEVFIHEISDFAMNTYDSGGAVKGAVIGERFIKTFNRYHFVHIPLGFGYEYGRHKKKQKWFVGAHLGVDANIFTHYKGNLINPENDKEILDFNTEKRNSTSFKNNIGFTINGDFTIYRKISGISELFLATKYAQTLKSITNEYNPISQKYQIIGLEVGFRKKIKQLKK